MKPARRRWMAALAAGLALSTAAAQAGAPPVVLQVLVDSTAEMPQALIQRNQLTDGILHDIGLALATRLGREARFRVLPRKRLADELVAGVNADIVCGYLPDWLPGDLDWSRPFLPDDQLLLSARPGPAPARLADLAGQRIGTVLGFVYPEMQQLLGPGFLRDDAPDAGANLRKLSLGRVRHAIVGRLQLNYQMRLGHHLPDLHPPLVISSYQSRCALSRRSSLTLAELDKAIKALQADGGLQRVLAKYR